MHNAELSLAALAEDSLVRVAQDGANFVVIRSGDGVFAYEDRCPHAFWPLSQGILTHSVLECPGHGWEFDIHTGRCLNAPAYCLTPVAVTISNDTVRLEWTDKESPTAATRTCSGEASAHS
jgi:3-phenylpropionate/trans-cinnamate dioxygenase ferredoxin component